MHLAEGQAYLEFSQLKVKISIASGNRQFLNECKNSFWTTVLGGRNPFNSVQASQKWKLQLLAVHRVNDAASVQCVVCQNMNENS